jgi:hypothetical protein
MDVIPPVPRIPLRVCCPFLSICVQNVPRSAVSHAPYHTTSPVPCLCGLCSNIRRTNCVAILQSAAVFHSRNSLTIYQVGRPDYEMLGGGGGMQMAVGNLKERDHVDDMIILKCMCTIYVQMYMQNENARYKG